MKTPTTTTTTFRPPSPPTPNQHHQDQDLPDLELEADTSVKEAGRVAPCIVGGESG